MKKRSITLVALLVMCAMLMSGFAVSAAVSTTETYSFTEGFDVAKSPAVTTAGVTEAYSQFVTIKTDADATLANLSIADGQVNTASNMTYSIATENAVPVAEETALTSSAAYVVDFDLKRTGASGMKAAYLGFRVPSAHASQDEMFYKTNTEHGIWLGMGTNFVVVPVGADVDPSVSNVNNAIGDGARWTGLKIDNSATKMTNHTRFRAYDNLAENKVTIYIVEEDESENFYASITVGSYNSADGTTALTYQIMDQDEVVLNVPGTIAGEGECYPQIVAFNMKPEIYSFGITGPAVDNAGLTTLKFNGEDCDTTQYEYTGIDPLPGGVVTVEAVGSYGAEYKIYKFDETEEWVEVSATPGVNEIETAGVTKFKVAVDACGTETEYIFNLSDNTPGAVTATPDPEEHYEIAQEVTLTGRTDRDDNTIYYTLDGSDPSDEVNPERIIYTGPFTVPANAETTVKAVEEIGGIYGSIAEFVYNIYVDVEEPAFSLAEGDYLMAKEVELSTEETTTIYYTLDESDPTDEENLSRVEYTEAIELALVEDEKTTYVVKAAAYRDDAYSEVVTKTYAIGVQVERYIMDAATIVSGTDPNFYSHDGTPSNKYHFTAGDGAGWIRVENGSDGSVQWELAVLKTEITSGKLGYTVDFDVKSFDNRISGHQGMSIYLRKKTTGITDASLTGVYTEAPIIMLYKDTIGVRNASWGNNSATRLSVPGMDLSSEAHITVTDDYASDMSVVYVDGEPIAYGKLSGTTYTLTVIATGETASVTLGAALPDKGFPAIGISHSPVQFKDYKVTVGKPVALNILTVSKPAGEYENNVSVEIAKYNDDLTLYYTLDGSDPADAGNINRIEYLGGIDITETTTLKAVATDGTNSTEMYEGVYTIVPYQPGEVRFSIEGGEYPSAQTLIMEGTGKPGAIVYYTTDGSDPSDSTNTNRVVYVADSEVDIPNNAATTVKAVEIIGSLTGEIYSHTYYTGTVKSPAISYYTDMQKLVIGQDTNWTSPSNLLTTSSFSLVTDTTDTIILSKGSDGTYQTASMRFFRSLGAADRAYKIEMDASGLSDDSHTYKAIIISPRSASTESITAYNTPRIVFQKSRIGIRSGSWGQTTASTMIDIPGMDLSVGGKIEFVDDMVRNLITIYIDGELVAVGKISGGTLTLTAVATGEEIEWSGTINASGYPRITSAHNASTIKNIVLSYPYAYDLPIIISHTADSYIGAQSVTLKNYFGTPVYYTLDGSDPADSTNTARVLYNGTVAVGLGTTTLKAVYYDEANGVYGGNAQHQYKVYADEAEVMAEIEALVTEEHTIDEQKLMISAIFGVADFTIENDSYYKELDDTDVWVKAYVEVLKEAREAKGSELDFADAKTSAYKAAVVAYFMDSIEADAVSAVVTKANDGKQQYKMELPLGKLGFDNMPESVQTWVLEKIKDNEIPDTEKLYELMYEAVALSTVSEECDVSGYTDTEKSTALAVIMNNTDLITSDDTFTDWGLGSKKQTKAINKILGAAEDQTVTTIEQLKTIADTAIDDVDDDNDDDDGPSTTSGYGGSSSFGTTTGSVVVPEVVVKFADAKNDAPWAYDAIIALSNIGVVAGYPDGTFCANNNVTREEFVKMLVVALDIYDETAVCEFTDASSGNWYDSYIASAVKLGIIQGVSETEFGVGVNITRQDMAVIVYRAVQSLGKQLPDVQEIAEFNDEADIAEYAGEAVDELQSANIINGMGDGTFAPAANANRAQAAYIINSIINAVQKA